MKSSKPPALAAWMLEHLMLGGANDALAGDLLEEFQRRRSVGWYWRQVLGAILASYSNELRADWVMVWTIVFTLAWAYGLYASLYPVFPLTASVMSPLTDFLLLHGYYGTAIWFAAGFIMRFGTSFLLLVATPLCIYLAGARNLTLRALARGLCAGVAVTFVLEVLPFQPVLDFLALHGLAYYWVQLWKWYEVMRQFVPLLIAMWAAQASRKRSQLAVIPG
jgi:hypothetical protein